MNRLVSEDSEIVCHFCQHRRRFIDPNDPFVFEGYGDFEVYRCPCGALGSPSGDIGGEAGYSLDHVEACLSTLLSVDRGRCRIDVNCITGTYPPIFMFWAKKRVDGELTNG